MQILRGDCLAVLKTLAADSLDSLVTDPPAGISFMGKEWDGDKGGREGWVAWLTDVMREVHRVLKPGAHGLVWAIPRTSHWTATALENAGFEVRDVVTHLFGTGFPKSLDISKAIDKAAGAERETTGFSTSGARKSEAWNRNTKTFKPNEGHETFNAPATDAAREWQGWGTALKPASEHWILVRKPLGEKTVAANVLRHGTGGVNIDGCRIGTDVISTPGGGDKLARMKTGESAGVGEYREHVGRFPANLVLSEGADGVLDSQAADNVSRFFYCAKASKTDRNNGCEGVLTWENQDQNLQGLMAECSQLAKATSGDIAPNTADPLWSTGSCGKSTPDQYQRALTFTTKTVTKLITDLKTSSSSQSLSTKESILVAIRTIAESGLSLAEYAESLSQSSPNTTSAETASAHAARLAVVRKLQEILSFAKRGNIHSTVKSSTLMAYLVRMITPPGGIVLDPFAGSGSTGVAARAEGMDFIGIEQDETYATIAEKRIAG